MPSVQAILDRYLTTERCCFCSDLRTGYMILSICGIVLPLLGALSNLATRQQDPILILISSLIPIGISSCSLYGIINNKSAWLLPDVILSVVGLIFIMIIGVIATILTFGIALLIFVPAGALGWHFGSVKYSLYMKMKSYDENIPQPGTVCYSNEVQQEPEP